MTAKTRAKPSLHRDNLPAPLARGTRTLPGAIVGLRLLKHTAGPLGTIWVPTTGSFFHLDTFALTPKLSSVNRDFFPPRHLRYDTKISSANRDFQISETVY
jgi:hypothetical protein